MTARFIPAQTRVTLRDAAGNSRWYTIREDIDLPAGDLQEAECPQTKQTKFYYEYKGWGVFFIREDIRSRLSPERMGEAQNLRLHMLQYDVPHGSTGTELQNGTRFAHPSTWLAKIAIRTTESVWIIPEGKIPYTHLDTVTEVGGKWRVFKFDPSEAQALVDACVLSLEAELKDSIRRSEESAARAREAYEESEDEPDTARKAYLTRAKAIKKRHEELCKNLASAAGVFGISLTQALSNAETRVAAVHAGMAERARQYAAAANAVRATGGDGAEAIATQIEANTMDAGVAADYLDENGGDGSALRAAFSNPEATTEGDTFSLVSDDEAE